MVFLVFPPICVYQTTPPKTVKGNDGIGIHPPFRFTFTVSPSKRRRDESSFKALRQDVTQKFFTIVTCNRLVFFLRFFPKKKHQMWKKHMLRSWPNWRKHIYPKQKSGWKIPKNIWNHHNCNLQSIFLDLEFHHWWEVDKSGDFVLKVDVYFCWV